MPRDPPADGGEALGRAYAEDAGRDRVRRADRRTKERRAGDDLGIVHTVAGRHERRREHLKPREGRIELVPSALCAQEHDEEHDQQPHTESSQRGEDQRQQYFGQDGAPVEG